MCSVMVNWTCLQFGFPIRKSSDHGSFANSPRLIAGYDVLLRLLMPRHPPIALKNLTTKIKDARVHCAVLKLRAVPAGLPTLTGSTPAVRRSNGTDVLPRPLHAHKRVENAGPKVGFHPLPQDPPVCPDRE